MKRTLPVHKHNLSNSTQTLTTTYPPPPLLQFFKHEFPQLELSKSRGEGYTEGKKKREREKHTRTYSWLAPASSSRFVKFAAADSDESKTSVWSR